MKVALFPGSFNPWHVAHEHVLKKALEIFEIVYVARGRNLSKPISHTTPIDLSIYGGRVIVTEFSGTMADYANKLGVDAVVRGLRNVFDFYEEKDNQYWHEDLGLVVPIFYVISDRSMGHISSRSIRIIDTLRNNKE